MERAANTMLKAAVLQARITQTAFAFRGYNTQNLGRTTELWQVPAYRPTLQKWLRLGSSVCETAHGGYVDLVARVTQQREAELTHYAEAVALVMAIELAQIDLLREVHHIDYSAARLAFGYSLGELTAATANEMILPRDAMLVPITLAPDCAALATEMTMGILFSRSEAIDQQKVARLADDVSAEGDGVVGISAVLTPNTLLVLGQGNSFERFACRVQGEFSKSVHLRRDSHRWPPLHTPVVRQRHVPDRASVLMQNMRQQRGLEGPELFSLATGSASYSSLPVHEILRKWVDHPQQLWSAVMYTLSSDIQVVVHVGPGPNVIPATFARVAENVRQQLDALTLSGLGMRAISGLANRRWLANLLPKRSALLRAPTLRHVILEDWLLEHAPG